MVAPEVERLGDAVRPILDARFRARERGLANSRVVIRSAANAIRSLHRGETDGADRLLTEARRLLTETVASLEDHPDVLHAGFVADAAKEYAEAELTAAAFAGRRLPDHAQIGVDPIPYLHGLGEMVGECRRRLLDTLRGGEMETAEELLGVMDSVVDLLAGLDYPDGMTSGLRRTTDIARSLVERSRADLTATAVQERLRHDLARRLG